MKAISLAFLFAVALALAACDDNSTDPGEDYIRPTIRQPLDGAIIRDSIYTVIVDAEQNCGCSSYMEFYVDSTHVYTDYIREFSHIMHTAEWQGEHNLIVRGVVPGSSSPNGIRVEGWDTVRVTFDLTK